MCVLPRVCRDEFSAAASCSRIRDRLDPSGRVHELLNVLWCQHATKNIALARFAMNDALPALSETTVDICLNARTFWCHVPAEVIVAVQRRTPADQRLARPSVPGAVGQLGPPPLQPRHRTFPAARPAAPILPAVFRPNGCYLDRNNPEKRPGSPSRAGPGGLAGLVGLLGGHGREGVQGLGLNWRTVPISDRTSSLPGRPEARGPCPLPVSPPG